MDTIFHLFKGIEYFLFSKHRKGEDIHSPFFYNLIRGAFMVKMNENDKKRIVDYRNSMLLLKKDVTVNKFGKGSNAYTNSIVPIQRVIKCSSSSYKTGTLLYSLSAYFKPNTIVELGTGVGIGTYYLHLGFPKAFITTVEGNSELAALAIANLNTFKNKQIKVINNSFSHFIDNFEQNSKIDMLYIDGDHSFEATVNNYLRLKDNLSSMAIVILDDIHWSRDMNRAFKLLCGREEVRLSIDLFQCGILVLNPKLSKEHWQIRR